MVTLSLTNEYIDKLKINVLYNEFIKGEYMPLSLSNNIYNKITDFPDKTYMECLNEIKALLNSAIIEYFYDLIIIRSNKKLSKEEKLTLVRYINICNKNTVNAEMFILYNGEIIYIPKCHTESFTKDEISQYINTVYKYYTKKRKLNIIKRKIKRVFRL